MCCKCRADLSIVTRRLYLFRGRMDGWVLSGGFLFESVVRERQCPGEIPSWAKQTSQKAVGPISHRKVLQRIHQRSTACCRGCQWPL